MTTPAANWRIRGGETIPIDRARIMGILNVTPDSFHDGGRHDAPEAAVARGVELIRLGAAILDIGGESTRPGAERISPDAQIRRVLPVIEGLRNAGVTAPISIDTTRAAVARRALDAGADIINDVAAGTEDDDMLRLAAETGAGLVLMHRLRPPDADRYSTAYADAPDYGETGGVVATVRAFLERRVAEAISAGVAPESIVVDPGLGFGKSVAQNDALIREIGEILSLGHHVLSAASRKSFLGVNAAGEAVPPDARLGGSVAATVLHRLAGVMLFRVHDPAEHAQALAIVERALCEAECIDGALAKFLRQ